MIESRLFRGEVAEQRKTRLHGDVVLSQPLSTRLMVGALITVIVVAGTWVSLGSYARIETVPGMLVTDIPSAKVVATQQGVVVALNATEGQLVKAGDRLAVINLDRRAATGETVASRGLNALEVRQRLARSQVDLSSRRANAETVRLLSVISAAKEQAVSLRDQIRLQEQVVASNQNLYDQIAKVVEKGFVSKVEFERRHQADRPPPSGPLGLLVH